MYAALAKALRAGAVGKPSVNSALWHTYDPKPDELAMSRVNISERRWEARTHTLYNALG